MQLQNDCGTPRVEGIAAAGRAFRKQGESRMNKWTKENITHGPGRLGRGPEGPRGGEGLQDLSPLAEKGPHGKLNAKSGKPKMAAGIAAKKRPLFLTLFLFFSRATKKAKENFREEKKKEGTNFREVGSSASSSV